MPTSTTPKAGQKTKAGKSGKTKTCTEGKTFPCGGACFSLGRPCKKEIGKETQIKAEEVAQNIKKGKENPSLPKTVEKQSTAKPVSTPNKTNENQNIKGLKTLKDSDLKLLGKVGTGFNGAEIVEDAQGNKYVKKYPKAIEGTATYGSTSEVMAEVVLKAIGVKAPEIYIQSDNKDGKYKAMYSKMIPGESVEAILDSGKNPKLRNIFLQESELSFLGKSEYGDYNGLQITQIKKGNLEIAIRHPDLAKIYAFDVFSSNPDRHGGNIFYDEKTDSFFPIDNEGAMSMNPDKKGLGDHYKKVIRNNFKHLLHKDKLSDEDKKGLQIFVDTLKKLANIDPDKLDKAYKNVYNKNKTPKEKDNSDVRTKAINNNIAFVKTLLKDFEYSFDRHGIKV